VIKFPRKYRLSALDFSYYLFLASVPIEVIGTMYYDFGVSLSLMTGVFFVFCYFFMQKDKNTIEWPHLMTLPLFWLFINLVHFLRSDSLTYFGVLTGVFNNLMFSVILYNYLLRNINIKNGLYVMGVSTSLAGVGLLASQGLNILAGGRFSIFDFDENNIGSILALGSLLLIMFSQEKECSIKWSVIQLLLAVLTLAIVVATGSRGAMLSLILALIFYQIIFFSKDMFRLKNFLIILAVVGFSTFFYQNSLTTRERWQTTLEGEANIALSERDVIFVETIDMISERPIAGWGLLQTYRELGQRFGQMNKGVHNTYLLIVVTTGILGSLPFFVFFIYPFAKFKEQKKDDLYKQLLVLLVFVMLVFMSLDWLNRKQLWILYSMLLARLMRQRSTMQINSMRQDGVF
jgi:O-antigen ligase